MESDQELASKAFIHFTSEEYEPCLKVLQSLSDSRPKDTRIQLNKLVVEFYQSGFCKTDELRKGLTNLKKQYETSDRHSGEELDDIALGCLLYNEAVVHFHLKQPSTAINLLERLFKIIEPLDDTLAIKVSFLLVELYLVTFEVDQANGMINFIKSTLLASKSTSSDKDNAAMEDYKIRLHKFKARALLLKSSLKECKRELKNVMNSDNSAAEALFLKSNYEFCRQNYPKSIRLLETAFKSPQQRTMGHSIPTMFHSDMACVYFHMSKFNIAVLHSKKALDENNLAMKSLPPFEKAHLLSGRPIQTLCMNRRHEILYNAGVELLFAGKGLQAFECLIEAHKTFYCNPRFWLRLAECCISVHQQTLKEAAESKQSKSPLVQEVLKSGQGGKIILPATSDKYIASHLPTSHSSAMPSATLEFATVCLQNVALLLPINNPSKKPVDMEQQSEDADSVVRSNQDRDVKVAIGTGQPLGAEALHALRLSLLACQAYVALEVSDYHKALNHGKQLLQMNPKIPGLYKFLGHLYVAEALIRLNKIPDAIKELSPQIVSDFDGGLDDQKSAMTSASTNGLFPKSLHEAKLVMLINLACAQCIQSDYEKAKRTLQQVARSKRTKEATNRMLLLSIYAELQTGNPAQALSIIKRGSVLNGKDIMEKFDTEAHAKYPNVVYEIEAQS